MPTPAVVVIGEPPAPQEHLSLGRVERHLLRRTISTHPHDGHDRREYETIGAERTPENPLGIYTYTPERIRFLSEEEVAARRRAAGAARGARFRELYAMLGLRAAVHADGTLDIAVGATSEATKGVMPCDVSSSPSTISMQI